MLGRATFINGKFQVVNFKRDWRSFCTSMKLKEEDEYGVVQTNRRLGNGSPCCSASSSNEPVAFLMVL